MSKEPVFGIDLGTTYSCIAYWNPERKESEVVTNPNTLATTLPSVVFVRENDKGNVEWMVGAKAENKQSGRDYKNVVSFAKNDIANDQACESGNYRRVYPTVKGKPLGPIDISAAILKELTDGNNRVKELNRGGEKIKAVITVPAYFTHSAKERTKQAGELAGLDVIGMIEEPVAAALSYGSRGQDVKNKTVMVYDLGGGTFDVTIVSFDNAGIGTVLVKEGNPQRGGKDWDNLFGLAIWEKFCDACGEDKDKLTQNDFEGDAQDDESQKLAHIFRAYAKQAKEELTNTTKVCIECKAGDYEEEIEMTREEFETVTKDLLNDTLSLVDMVMEKFKKNPEQKLDIILLVGGSTFMPQIKTALSGRFSGIDIRLEEPNWAVAKGAAIFAASRPDLNNSQNNASDGCSSYSDNGNDIIPLTIKNIASMSYGIEAVVDENQMKKAIAIMITKGTDLPATSKTSFATLIEGQCAMRFKVYESNVIGEELPLEQGRLISPKDTPPTIKFPKPVKKGYSVDVVMTMDAGGYLHISAVDGKDSSNVLEFDISVKGGMSEEEICKRSNALGFSQK